ncbi:MAG TPA: DUF1016 domain-containing protein [Tissierellia bacterium]|nr:DUF1016 domain-containing protein [Tissierellia bacterium]
MEEARRSVVLTLNTTLIKTYYEIGKTMVEDEQVTYRAR